MQCSFSLTVQCHHDIYEILSRSMYIGSAYNEFGYLEHSPTTSIFLENGLFWLKSMFKKIGFNENFVEGSVYRKICSDHCQHPTWTNSNCISKEAIHHKTISLLHLPSFTVIATWPLPVKTICFSVARLYFWFWDIFGSNEQEVKGVIFAPKWFLTSFESMTQT